MNEPNEEARARRRPYVCDPITKHTHTVIMLHDRGTYGSEFAVSFFSPHLSSFDAQNPNDDFPRA